MGKKPFIDRKKAKHFQLVHRSQRDPLINDNEASSRVLVEVFPPNLRGKDKKIDDGFEDYQRRQKEIESRVGQAALYGVYFDDTEYDYLQHLKQVGESEGETIFIEASKKEKKLGGNFELKKDLKSEDDKDDLFSFKDKISLPKEVLPSKEELPLGLLNQSAIPEDIQGFHPDMDPKLRETLEALEDDAYINNDLDDDFFVALNAGDDEFYEEEEEEEEEDSEFGRESGENWELEFKKFRRNKNRTKESDYDDDKRSRTTGGYSMTSSIMFRNDKLRLLDEQFEKISKEYIEEDDDESDEESTSSQIRQDFSQILDEFLDKYEIDGRKVVQKLEGDNGQDQLETIRQGLGKVIVNDDNSSQKGENDGRSRDIFVHVESEEKDKRQAWDCQSILSTYSNLENHPTLIREKSRQKIKINRKTGLPIVESSVENKEIEEEEEEGKEMENEENEKANLGAARPKNESKEGKKLRKQNIKSERKNRRTEKKSLKQAFAKERTRQNKISHNISKNLVGAIHLD